MIEMQNPIDKYEQLPIINLIYTDETIEKTVNRFDFNYCKGIFYINKSGHNELIYDDDVSQTIYNKKIEYKFDHNDKCSFYKISKYRVHKAMRYGYLKICFGLNLWNTTQMK